MRTKIRPMYVPWNPEDDLQSLRKAIDEALAQYRKDYAHYYRQYAKPEDPAMRDASPTVVLIPGIGMFSFGKSKTESRITGEFYVNAIHVMEGASALESGAPPAVLPQAGRPRRARCSRSIATTLLCRPRRHFVLSTGRSKRPSCAVSRRRRSSAAIIMLIVGGGSGIGREVVRLGAGRGAHVVVADRDLEGAAKSAELVTAGKEFQLAAAVDIRDRAAIRELLRKVVAEFGGLDIIVNTAAIFPSSADGHVTDEQWAATLQLNVTANHLLVDEAAKIFAEQALDVSVVLTSSANAVVAKRGSEAYDVSKAAVSHLVREMAVALSPRVRVNGISPATVVKGSTMFPRERVMASLTKYNLPFERTMTDDELRTLLANFYAQRTLTHQPIDPEDCANAILFLAGPQARCTSGHLIPVDGGLAEAFLR